MDYQQSWQGVSSQATSRLPFESSFALNLFVSLYNIFISLLNILGGGRRR